MRVVDVCKRKRAIAKGNTNGEFLLALQNSPHITLNNLIEGTWLNCGLYLVQFQTGTTWWRCDTSPRRSTCKFSE